MQLLVSDSKKNCKMEQTLGLKSLSKIGEDLSKA